MACTEPQLYHLSVPQHYASWRTLSQLSPGASGAAGRRGAGSVAQQHGFGVPGGQRVSLPPAHCPALKGQASPQSNARVRGRHCPNLQARVNYAKFGVGTTMRSQRLACLWNLSFGGAATQPDEQLICNRYYVQCCSAKRHKAAPYCSLDRRGSLENLSSSHSDGWLQQLDF